VITPEKRGTLRERYIDICYKRGALLCPSFATMRLGLVMGGTGVGQMDECCCCLWEHLTKREVQIAALVASGMSNEQVGRRLNLSAHTVSSHVEAAMHRLGAANRTELVARCYVEGLLDASTWPPSATGRRCVRTSPTTANSAKRLIRR
jgi:DNA-binding CsgD family transcriptional regulator